MVGPKGEFFSSSWSYTCAGSGALGVVETHSDLASAHPSLADQLQTAGSASRGLACWCCVEGHSALTRKDQ